MIWVVSKAVCGSLIELNNRHRYIEEVTDVPVSPWVLEICKNQKTEYPVYKCQSKKGKYGLFITAHVNELDVILESLLLNKQAIVVVNSCKINQYCETTILSIVKQKSKFSQLFYARQELVSQGVQLNYADNIGDFGFKTTWSERMMFRCRKEGLIKAIMRSFRKIGVMQ